MSHKYKLCPMHAESLGWDTCSEDYQGCEFAQARSDKREYDDDNPIGPRFRPIALKGPGKGRRAGPPANMKPIIPVREAELILRYIYATTEGKWFADQRDLTEATLRNILDATAWHMLAQLTTSQALAWGLLAGYMYCNKLKQEE